MSSILQSLLVLTCSVLCLYFVCRTYASIRRIRYINYFHHYRLYMPIAGVLVSSGAGWACATVTFWYVPVVVIFAGIIMGVREIAWALAAEIGIFDAKRKLSAERNRFRAHTDDDRELLRKAQSSLESAEWACKALRFRDAYRCAKSALSRLHLMRVLSARSAQ